MALSCQGYLDKLSHTFACLHNKYDAELVFDPMEPEIYENASKHKNWVDTIYGNGIEVLPIFSPICRAFGFKVMKYLDSGHAGNNITHHSQTGVVVYLNSARVYWYSKKQGSIKSSSFRIECIAPKLYCEYLCGLRCKLQMIGTPCDFLPYIYGNNKSVFINSSEPFLVIKRKVHQLHITTFVKVL